MKNSKNFFTGLMMSFGFWLLILVIAVNSVKVNSYVYLKQDQDMQITQNAHLKNADEYTKAYKGIIALLSGGTQPEPLLTDAGGNMQLCTKTQEAQLQKCGKTITVLSVIFCALFLSTLAVFVIFCIKTQRKNIGYACAYMMIFSCVFAFLTAVLCNKLDVSYLCSRFSEQGGVAAMILDDHFAKMCLAGIGRFSIFLTVIPLGTGELLRHIFGKKTEEVNDNYLYQ